jgi:hypothetical protein
VSDESTKNVFNGAAQVLCSGRKNNGWQALS